ncbi:integrin alpha-IIb [Mizugakiibacter sediminis]|uniref:Integrin alpha-IIb n=1 Tax=Mizugakiibacter sediminis TaxID=1475481 RepID=A0A0K8QM03_9GAMM|nr:integrin alpha-IIb [Mizugakiibacter sediminis]
MGAQRCLGIAAPIYGAGACRSFVASALATRYALKRRSLHIPGQLEPGPCLGSFRARSLVETRTYRLGVRRRGWRRTPPLATGQFSESGQKPRITSGVAHQHRFMGTIAQHYAHTLAYF